MPAFLETSSSALGYLQFRLEAESVEFPVGHKGVTIGL
jgi:hypothetical protein